MQQNNRTQSVTNPNAAERSHQADPSERAVTFPAPRSRLHFIGAAVAWAIEVWEEAYQANERGHPTVTLTLRPDTLTPENLRWVLANLPGCEASAERLNLSRDYTGKRVRSVQDLAVPPRSSVLLSCMAGVVRLIDTMKMESAEAEWTTALLQFGVDINEARGKGGTEEANSLVRQASQFRQRLVA
jgi:hypothetical protein